MRRQLYSDWYKYMLSAYPPEESRDDYPDSDEVRSFVERKVLAPLAAAEQETGALWLTADEAGGVSGASAHDSRADSLAALVATDINSLAAEIADHNKSPEVSQSQSAFALRQSASATPRSRDSSKRVTQSGRRPAGPPATT